MGGFDEGYELIFVVCCIVCDDYFGVVFVGDDVWVEWIFGL